MIRSCRIPSVLERICTENYFQTALLVTTDGELLGSTAKYFFGPDGTSKESIESLGTLIADIAVDYSRLGEEYANLDIGSSSSNNNNNNNTGTTAASMTTTSTASGGGSSSAIHQQSSNNNRKKCSHLQCLLLELELGLVAVSTCVGVDCMVIAIASPTAPLGSIKARLHAITEYVQEALSPLTATDPTSSIASSYR
mmetsp:Transcript_52927/g.59155  ORF Transcript_52927/g.59155 Transcript_52927/m.59155 type:complete len:197 (-) Transcript_52927:113-703(-)